MADAGFFLPTDVLVLILLRLPTSARRRFRLVSKLWRDAIDERTTEMQSRSKILAFFSVPGGARACVIHDEYRRPDDEWEFFTDSGVDHGLDIENGIVHMVGSCNGLICLRDCCWSSWFDYSYLNLTKIVIVNPMTGKTIELPPEPEPWVKPSDTGQSGGDPAWREVPTPADSSYNDSGNLVSVDGTTYWLTTQADRVVALDLEDEHVTSIDAPPVVRLLQMSKHDAVKCHLTSVQARLGVVIMRQSAISTRVDVWVLERSGGGGDRRYSLLESSSDTDDHGRWITTPQFTHGDYVLSIQDRVWPYNCWMQLHRRKAGDLTANSGKNAKLWPLEGAEFLMEEELLRGTVTTFAYVETLEPLPSGFSSHCRTGTAYSWCSFFLMM
ncbi:hypothetical protein QOZ80_8AG0635500 [Eleusine coracana subsp. coracana]|nr:hypothetical protein QOZ80_8AG0635500 [Eleusine coracana subsp. coracana]